MAATLCAPRESRSAQSAPSRRPISKASRVAWRDSYGDLQSMIAGADRELQHGSPRNALTGYQVALVHWLRVRFVELTGKHQSPIFDADRLLLKLRGRGDVDRWTYDLIRCVLKRVPKPDRRHVEIVGAIVASLSLEPLSRQEVSE